MFTDRDIYAYQTSDGRVLYADPIAVTRQLRIITRGRLNDLCQAMNALATPETPPSEDTLIAGLIATGEAAQAAVVAFRLEPFDPTTGQGTTEKEALDILAKFLFWLDEKKASGRTP